jgi:hypothetical protein
LAVLRLIFILALEKRGFDNREPADSGEVAFVEEVATAALRSSAVAATIKS